MWLKQCHKTSPSHHHFYRWYVYHSQSWVVYDIVLSTWNTIGGSQSYGRFFTSPTGPSQSYGHDFYSHPIDPERWVSVVPGSYIWGLHLQSSSRSVFHHHGAGIWIPTFTPKMTQLLCSPKYSSTMGCICYLGHFAPHHPTENLEELTVFTLKVLQLRRRKSVSPDFLQTMDDWENKYTVDDSRWLSYIILYDSRCLWWL